MWLVGWLGTTFECLSMVLGYGPSNLRMLDILFPQCWCGLSWFQDGSLRLVVVVVRLCFKCVLEKRVGTMRFINNCFYQDLELGSIGSNLFLNIEKCDHFQNLLSPILFYLVRTCELCSAQPKVNPFCQEQ
jgi:hypothetical protein